MGWKRSWLEKKSGGIIDSSGFLFYYSLFYYRKVLSKKQKTLDSTLRRYGYKIPRHRCKIGIAPAEMV